MRALAVIVAAATLMLTNLAVTGATVAERKLKACEMLEQEEIAEVFGVEVGEAERGGIPSTCIWTIAGGSGAGGGEIATLIERGRSARVSFDSARTIAGEDDVEIEGIGRKAFYVPAITTMFVLETKRTLFTVQAVYPSANAPQDAEDLQAKLTTLAALVSERL